MTIQLRLDTQALEALFPEGSKARVDLQAAVIAEFVRKHIKTAALGPDVQRLIEKARSEVNDIIGKAKTEMVEKVLRDQGVTRTGSYGKIELSNQAKQMLSDATRQEIFKTIGFSIEDQVKNIAGTVRHDAQAAVNRLVDSEIKAAVKARVQEVAKGVLGGA